MIEESDICNNNLFNLLEVIFIICDLKQRKHLHDRILNLYKTDKRVNI